MLNSLKTARIILLLSILAFVYYLFAFVIVKDVYRYAFVGAVYELLWLPMLIMMAVIPVLSLIMLARNRDIHWLYPVVSLLLIVAAVLLMLTAGK
jgi:hypothetical protein